VAVTTRDLRPLPYSLADPFSSENVEQTFQFALVSSINRLWKQEQTGKFALHFRRRWRWRAPEGSDKEQLNDCRKARAKANTRAEPQSIKPAILGQDQEKVVSKSGIEAMIA
jgi:hypothetical protein